MSEPAEAALVAFGTHATPDLCAYTGPLTFSGEGEDGMPRWERHDGCTAYITTTCPTSKRVDDPTLHSTRFDGDDPYTICVYCGETRDARTGRIIKPAKASLTADNETGPAAAQTAGKDPSNKAEGEKQ